MSLDYVANRQPVLAPRGLPASTRVRTQPASSFLSAIGLTYGLPTCGRPKVGAGKSCNPHQGRVSHRSCIDMTRNSPAPSAVANVRINQGHYRHGI